MDKLILPILISLILSGCGGSEGGSGSSDTPTTSPDMTLKGTVIDGYVQGATVFLDQNFNGQLDQGEPSTITNKDGAYSLPVVSTDPCLGAAPIIVNVPIGAVDSTAGVVTAAYQMVTPPSAFDSYTGSDSNTTPLTTMVWDEVQKQAMLEGVKFTCDALVGVKSSTSEWLLNTMKTAESTVVTNLKDNESMTDSVQINNLYQDFIVQGRADLELVAQEHIDTLQQTEKAKSESNNPNSLVRVLSKFEHDHYGITQSGTYVSTVSMSVGKNATVSVMEEVKDENDALVYTLKRTLVDTSKWNYLRETIVQIQNNQCFENAYVVSTNEEERISTNRIFNTVDYIDDSFTCPVNPDSVKQTLLSFSEDTQSNTHVHNEKDIEIAGTTETLLEYTEEKLALWVVSPLSATFNQDIDRLFSDLTDVMLGNESFDQSPSSVSNEPSGWEKVFRYEIGTFNKTHVGVKRNNNGLWKMTKAANDGYQVPETFCLRPAIFEEVNYTPVDGQENIHNYREENGKYFEFVSELDGQIFEENGDPLDYWMNNSDRGGDAVWIAVPSDYQPQEGIFDPCDIKYDAWTYRGLYIESGNAYSEK